MRIIKVMTDSLFMRQHIVHDFALAAGYLMQAFQGTENAENPTCRRFSPSKKGAGFAQFLFGNRWNNVGVVIIISCTAGVLNNNDAHDISQGIVQDVAWNTTSNRTRNG